VNTFRVGRYSQPLKQVGRFLLLCACLMTSIGCPLATYQEKMAAEQTRLAYMDEQNKVLEKEPIVLPDRKKVDPAALTGNEFFLRPPKGIPINALREEGTLMARYRRLGLQPGIVELSVAAISAEKTKKREEFQTKVLEAFGINIATKPKTKMLGEQINHPLAFDWYHQDLADQIVQDVYIFDTEKQPPQPVASIKQPPRIVALIFRSTAPGSADTANTDRVIDFSLTSLGVGDYALRQHYLWKKPVAPPPKPPGE
jgi:hypothetical protein